MANLINNRFTQIASSKKFLTTSALNFHFVLQQHLLQLLQLLQLLPLLSLRNYFEDKVYALQLLAVTTAVATSAGNMSKLCGRLLNSFNSLYDIVAATVIAVS